MLYRKVNRLLGDIFENELQRWNRLEYVQQALGLSSE